MNEITEISFTAAVHQVIEATGAESPPKLSIRAYTGGPMYAKGLGMVVIDLAGLEVPQSFSILADHNTSIDGVVANGAGVVNGGILNVGGPVAVSSAAGKKVLGLLRDGVPLQASIGARITERNLYKDGETFKANGRTFRASSPVSLVTKSTLQEVSVVTLGADSNTSTSLAAAAAQGDIVAKGNVSMSDSNSTVVEVISGNDSSLQANGGEESPVAVAEQLRIEKVRKIANRHPEIVAKAVGEGWTADKTELAVLRAETTTGITGGIIKRRPLANASIDTITASLALRAGVSESAIEAKYGERVIDDASQTRRMHALDIVRAACEMDGLNVDPHDRFEMVRASLSNKTLPTALGNLANLSTLSAYHQAPATWRAFAQVRQASNFKDHTAVRANLRGSLSEVGIGGEVRHATIDEDTFTYAAKQYAKLLTIDRKELINDSLGVFADTAAGFGRMAARNAADLVYGAILGNAGSFFSSGNGNLLTGGTSALGYTSLSNAIAAFRKQVDAESNNLDIQPAVLVVPPELEVLARQLLDSQGVQILQADASQGTGRTSAPNGNPLKASVKLEVEARLSNTAKWSTASTTAWFMFASPSDSPIVFAHLGNQEAPIIEYFGLSTDVAKLAASYRVIQDVGVALADYRGALRSDGV